MQIENHISLKSHNTFGIEVFTDQLIRVRSTKELFEIINSPILSNQPRLILGGGSNLLFTDNFPGIILKNEIFGREKIKEDDAYVWVKVGAGESWHEIVLWAIENNWAGIENLSLIPGTMGAAPMQNIGAYGVELAEVFESLEAVHLTDSTLHTFDRLACQFDYRHSIFKGELKGQHMITSVTLKLYKQPRFNISYGALERTIHEMGVQELSIKAVSDAVIAIRQSKLPDPDEIGNAGSFFKNPTISKGQFEIIQQQYPDTPGYELPHDQVKVPAGWLIEQCGWKGQRRGEIGVHEKQALVLVNHGKGQGHAIHQLALDIQASVVQKFNIQLNPEVNIVQV